jgi:Icc-related predicted phosphoesterase
VITLVELDPEPVHWVRYLNAARGGGSSVERLPIARARATGLPAGVDAIVATSDLQGVVPDPHTRASILLGVAVAEALEELAFDDVLPSLARTGALLAGDLYSVPGADKRGGYGDVADVWRAFAERFAWVAGVAGNHDDVGRVEPAAHVHLLDGARVDLDGLRIGGVGLIAGNPGKRGRRAEDDQLARIEEVVAGGVDVLLVHEGPAGDADAGGQPGHATIRELVEAYEVPLTVCGHAHWEPALARHPRGQILNVDARVVVLTRA